MMGAWGGIRAACRELSTKVMLNAARLGDMAWGTQNGCYYYFGISVSLSQHLVPNSYST